MSAWLADAEARLIAAGVDSPRLEAQVLLGHGLGRDRAWVLAHGSDGVDPSTVSELLERRLRREPLAYILGYREFYGRRFRVTPDVLVPRQETETLIAAVVESASRRGAGATVLDLGTGSGCLAITLKLERPEWKIAASDLSAKSIEVARRNAAELGADVEFVLSDLFAELPDRRFDLIVTNPPYIGNDEPLMPEVVQFEPPAALFSGPTGLEFYVRLAAEAPAFLVPGARLLTEVGYRQADAVAELFVDAGWTHVRTVADLSGTPRVVSVHPA